MSDISHILGSSILGSSNLHKNIDPPEIQLRNEIAKAGLTPPDQIFFDGKIHRFKSGTKGASGHTDKPGWYIVFGDGIPAGRFGCWRAGVEITWRAEIGREITAAEQMAHARRMSEAKILRDLELNKKHEIAASTVEKIWTDAAAATADHPYLQRKKVKPHGARVTGDGRLIVPLYSATGELSSLQYIAHDGTKLYHAGGQTSGKFWMLGVTDEPGTIYVAEGFATAATIHEITNRPVVVAYSASNLVPTTAAIREAHGAAQDIVIVADNDESGVGQRYAEQSSAKYGVRVVLMPSPGDANDFVSSGGDLSSLLTPPANDWLIAADDFSAQPAPISWLVKRWIQDQALVMVHGPSGGGKTFVVLDWCLSMAAGFDSWFGYKVRPASVVYLAGEGHHGLKGRIAAWKLHNKSGHLDMWLSKSGCDLNTPSGYLKVVDQIRFLPKNPSVIVVDTLHRFLSGDENSAQDAKTMLDACSALMLEFGCSVILVHHTGVSEEAQHRARGSSAWRGALDIEISVIPGKVGIPMQIVQRKSKDAEIAEPVYVELKQVTIDGWLDDDGEPVTSAVIIEAEKPIVAKKDSKMANHCKTFENAWEHSGAEIRNDLPYLSRSAMTEYLIQKMGLSDASARQYIKPSLPGKPISDLLIAEMIENFEHGWIVLDEILSSSMLIKKAGNSKK